ncbi:unnamed protein product [Soboliphyme baturini]|uniref:Uncharacterized protein n=1 Tax=Soboliphyme baturini TaxID=241478 RepID=A0A183IL58_9BILA|nr:unnamed protein product [Soboliphyme baturini]
MENRLSEDDDGRWHTTDRQQRLSFAVRPIAVVQQGYILRGSFNIQVASATPVKPNEERLPERPSSADSWTPPVSSSAEGRADRHIQLPCKSCEVESNRVKSSDRARVSETCVGVAKTTA